MDNLRVEPMMLPTTAPSDDYVCDPDLRLRLGEAEVEQYAETFKALGNPIRVQTIDLISQGGGQICACDIERHFDLTQPTISHHLKVLREAGLIYSEPRGVWVMHRINTAKLSILQALLILINNTGR